VGILNDLDGDILQEFEKKQAEVPRVSFVHTISIVTFIIFRLMRGKRSSTEKWNLWRTVRLIWIESR
jgi:hypothetical protein